MTMVAEVKVRCGGTIHTISVYEPGDSFSCLPESSVVSKKGYIICLKDHNYDSTRAFVEMGMDEPPCFWDLRIITGDNSAKKATNSYLLAMCVSLDKRARKGGKIQKKEIELIKYFICLGASISTNRYLILDIIVKYSLEEALVLVVAPQAVDSKWNDALVLTAAKEGNLVLLRSIPQSTYNIHPTLDAALILASRNGDLDMVKYLVGKRASIHVLEDAPFRYAVKHRQMHVVEYLIKKGAHVSAFSNQAIEIAVKRNNYQLVEMLIAAGLKKSTKYLSRYWYYEGYKESSRPPYKRVKRYGKARITKAGVRRVTTIRHGKHKEQNISALDIALDAALSNHQLDMAHLLYEKGADIMNIDPLCHVWNAIIGRSYEAIDTINYIMRDRKVLRVLFWEVFRDSIDELDTETIEFMEFFADRYFDEETCRDLIKYMLTIHRFAPTAQEKRKYNKIHKILKRVIKSITSESE